jgi:hypothetical protein
MAVQGIPHLSKTFHKDPQNGLYTDKEGIGGYLSNYTVLDPFNVITAQTLFSLKYHFNRPPFLEAS